MSSRYTPYDAARSRRPSGDDSGADAPTSRAARKKSHAAFLRALVEPGSFPTPARADRPRPLPQPGGNTQSASFNAILHADFWEGLLRDIQRSLKNKRLDIDSFPSLVFAYPPKRNEGPLPVIPNPDRYSLDPLSLTNTTFLALEREIHRYARQISSDSVPPLQLLLDVRARLQNLILQMDLFARAEWEKQRYMINFPYADPGKKSAPLLWCITEGILAPDFGRVLRLRGFTLLGLGFRLLSAAFYLFGRDSRSDSNWRMRGTRLLLALNNKWAYNLPTDIRSVIKSLELEPPVDVYVCCPSCFALYPDGHSPRRCERRLLPLTVDGNQERRCSRPLFKFITHPKGLVTESPISRLVLRRIKDYVASLLSRPDIEDAIEATMASAGTGHLMDDILQSPGIKRLKDRFGRPFCRPDRDTLRLVFRLSEDGVNPLGRKLAGKQASIGPVWIICLSLPKALRQQRENMQLLTIIPGPTGPHRDRINSILEVIVDQFLELYDPGVYIARTARHPHGRHVEGALQISANDLPAARQLSGYASHSHTQCCHLCHITLQDLDNLDMASWPARCWERDRQAGFEWKNARTVTEQEELYRRNGVRYSPFQRIGYLNVMMCTVLDVMHMFSECLIPAHTRKVFGMDHGVADGAGLAVFFGRRSSDEDFSAGLHTLQWGSDSAVGSLKANVLKDLCQELNLQYGGQRSRHRMVKHLKSYVRSCPHEC